VLALLLTGLCAFFSGNNLLFLVFSAMMALLLVSGFLSRLGLAGLEIELLLPEHVSARTPTPARVRIRNLKWLTPSFSIELLGQRDPLTNAPSILADPIYFPIVPGRATVEAAVEVTFAWRGHHRDNLFEIATRFPFGFLRRSTRVTLQRETLVYPSLQPHETAEAILAGLDEEAGNRATLAGLDFYRIRPYETGDDARFVDWKSTAHTGDLEVREFSRDEQRCVEIYLDRHAPHEWFESAVETCAYLVWELTGRETGVVVRGQSAFFAVPEDFEVYEVLRWLAVVEPLTGRGREPDPPAHPDAVQLVISPRPEAFEAAGWSPVEIIALQSTAADER
jgi:uncharacterized protein (DUF58 family)